MNGNDSSQWDCVSGRGYDLSSIADIGNKRVTAATLIAISRRGACAKDCTSCRLIRSSVGRPSRREHISGLSRRQHATTTNHRKTARVVVVVVVVVGENCFRCRHINDAHLTYDGDVTVTSQGQRE